MLNQRIINIHNFPFVDVMANAGTTPVLFDCFIPEMGLVIWKMRPCDRNVVTDEFLSAAVELFDRAIEHEMPKPGAIIKGLEGYSLFVFPTTHRAAILQQMEITELVPTTVAP